MKFRQFRVFNDQVWKTVCIGPEEQLKRVKRKTITNYSDRHNLLEQDQHQCRKCGRGVSIERMDFDIDHIQPVKYSGTIHPDNLQILCTGCHRLKTFYPCRGVVEKEFTSPINSLYVFEKFENKLVGETTRRELGCLQEGVYTMQKELGDFRPKKCVKVLDEEYMKRMVTLIDKICKAIGFNGIEDRTTTLPLNSMPEKTRDADTVRLLDEALRESRGRNRCYTLCCKKPSEFATNAHKVVTCCTPKANSKETGLRI